MKWSRAYKDRLPDSAFLAISPGGHKVDGRTHPLSLRHLPVRDLQGNVSVSHVRNALARIAHTGISAAQKKLARAKAEKLLRRHEGPFPPGHPKHAKPKREPRSLKDVKRIIELEKALKKCRHLSRALDLM